MGQVVAGAGNRRLLLTIKPHSTVKKQPAWVRGVMFKNANSFKLCT